MSKIEAKRVKNIVPEINSTLGNTDWQSGGDGGGGSSANLYGAHFYLSDYADLFLAKAAVENFESVNNVNCALVIDEDCDLTGVTPQEIIFNNPVIVQKGFKFITDTVTRDVTGAQNVYYDLTLTGTSGSANVSLRGDDYSLGFNTDLATTAIDFVSIHGANILAATGVSLLAIGDSIRFSGARWNIDLLGITNLTGDLDGAFGDLVQNLTTITGTVEENYMQITFYDDFIANKHVKIFQGHGLIWFKGVSTDAVYAAWWGMGAFGNSGPNKWANVSAFQNAINSVVLNFDERSTSTVKLPSGQLFMHAPVVAFGVDDLNEHPYLTGRRNDATVRQTILHVEGAEPIKHEINYRSTSNLMYEGAWGAPIIIQGGRNCSFKNIRFEGENDKSARDDEWLDYTLSSADVSFSKLVLRPDDWSQKANTSWVSNNVYWQKYRPYCAILFDPFRKAVGDSNTAYSSINVKDSTVDLYYATGEQPHTQCWDIVVSDVHVMKFVEGFVIGLHGQQNDTYLFDRIMCREVGFGIVSCQDQARDVRVKEFMMYLGCYAAISTQLHGNGVYPEVHSLHSAGGLKYLFHGSKGNGPFNVNNIYCELVYGFGTNGSDHEEFGLGSLVGSKPDRFSDVDFYSNISSVTLKMGITQNYTADGLEGWLFRPPAIAGTSITNVLIGKYGGNEEDFLQAYKNCDIRGAVFGQNSSGINPVDLSFKSNFPTTSLVLQKPLSGKITENVSVDHYNRYVGTTSGGTPIVNKIGEDDFTLIGGDKQEAAFLREVVSSSTTVTYFIGYFEFEYSGTIPLNPNDLLICNISTGNFNVMCKVKSVTGKTIKCTQISRGEHEDFIANIDGSSQVTLGNVKRVEYEQSHSPANVSTKSNPDEILVSHYGFVGRTATPSTIEVGMDLRLPDGESYNVIDDLGDGTFVLDRNYSGSSFNNEWIIADTETAVTLGLRQNSNQTRGFFVANRKYRYWPKKSGLDKEHYLICVSTGCIRNYSDGKEAWRPNLIKYKNNGDVATFLKVKDSQTTDIPSTEIDFNKTGTTAERPDNLGIPTENIPHGYIYDNTTDVTTEIWNGVTWKVI